MRPQNPENLTGAEPVMCEQTQGYSIYLFCDRNGPVGSCGHSVSGFSWRLQPSQA